MIDYHRWIVFYVLFCILGRLLAQVGASGQKDSLLRILKRRRCAKYCFSFITFIVGLVCVYLNYWCSQSTRCSNTIWVKSGLLLIGLLIIGSLIVFLFNKFYIERMYGLLDSDIVETLWLTSMILCILSLLFIENVIALTALGALLGKFIWFDIVNDILKKKTDKGSKKLEVTDLLTKEERKAISSKIDLLDKYGKLNEKVCRIDKGDTIVIVVTEYVWMLFGIFMYWILSQRLEYYPAAAISLVISFMVSFGTNKLAEGIRKKMQPCSGDEYTKYIEQFEKLSEDIKRCITGHGKYRIG